VPTVAILPVKSFRLGKGRMAEHLTDDARSGLGRALAERTAALAVDAGLIPVLVAGDGEVAEWAILHGFPSIPDPGEGLDGAALAGVRWATEAASEWMVVHTDLPLLTAVELEDLDEALSASGMVIAPSADGGTSALGACGPAAFSYGSGSFHRHLGLFPAATIVARTGLLHDIDTVADLESARRHPRGAWLADLT
jgi:2-phospho-L-lactate guanylyltransferase